MSFKSAITDNVMLYSEFKKQNDISKDYFPQLGKVSNVNFQADTCTLAFADCVTDNIPIQVVVDDIVLNGMGAISNPSILKYWRGFDT